MKRSGVLAAAMAALLVVPDNGMALEGGVETYLLGSRDSMAGILPPPGTYLNNDMVYFSGSAPSISAGGSVLVSPELNVFTYKFNLTHVFEAPIGSARFGINLNIPLVDASMDFKGQVGSGLSGTLSDTVTAFSDIVVTPLFNWTHGKLNTTLALQTFLPTGSYQPAVIDVRGRKADVLNAGKNRAAFDPTVAMTWFDPSTGWEFSGALGVTFSARNKTTDYKSAPEAHFEGTVLRHLPNKMGIGITGYAYQQLGDDTGSGADAFRAAIGAQSLQARVFGLGPMMNWSTTVGQVPVSIKAKYIMEFGAKRRFESDKLWVTVGVVF